MAHRTLSNYDDYFVSTIDPNPGETANAIFAKSGDDVVYGNGYVDYIYGGNGSDYLNGEGNDDILLGESGNDILEGGLGDDLLLGGSGHDQLYGGEGLDRLWGGTGNDLYYADTQYLDVDIINDDKSPTGQTGYGGGYDAVKFFDLTFQGTGIFYEQRGDDLFLGESTLSRGVIVEDFYKGGDNVVEVLIDATGVQQDLTFLLG
ncbi:calcium-binding protein [Oceanospirillum beijerinckii]|uniref:calcium-binding protein n=1 Tax=Oceanospirillum beijerinckii TaxID=64976 RepID=UPI00042A298D|nr:hypothetical protein [Oceanospirillum beijerinckii]